VRDRWSCLNDGSACNNVERLGAIFPKGNRRRILSLQYLRVANVLSMVRAGVEAQTRGGSAEGASTSVSFNSNGDKRERDSE